MSNQPVDNVSLDGLSCEKVVSLSRELLSQADLDQASKIALLAKINIYLYHYDGPVPSQDVTRKLLGLFLQVAEFNACDKGRHGVLQASQEVVEDESLTIINQIILLDEVCTFALQKLQHSRVSD